MPAKGKCRSCGAEILWAETTAGKRIPLDLPSERRFLVVPLPDSSFGIAGIATSHETYETHFVTCPNAAEHRTT